ncbi:MAG TPA: hypothetical protein VG963_09550 [Polyangiaceae bacterium]|nr:hypothetical protein [Polyangiaceae bacterium]
MSDPSEPRNVRALPLRATDVSISWMLSPQKQLTAPAATIGSEPGRNGRDPCGSGRSV